jgi:hypothetical protein
MLRSPLPHAFYLIAVIQPGRRLSGFQFADWILVADLKAALAGGYII